MSKLEVPENNNSNNNNNNNNNYYYYYYNDENLIYGDCQPFCFKLQIEKLTING